VTLNEQVSRAVGWLSVPDAEHDLAMAWRAYEVVRAQGWRIYSVLDHPQREWFSVGLVWHGEGLKHPADATGATFAEALSRAVVKAMERSEEVEW